MTNAVLTITQDCGTHKIPVTWVKDGFMECEELYEEILTTDTLIDWDYDMEITVELDSEPTIKCQVRWDDVAGVVYPARNLEKLVGKKV